MNPWLLPRAARVIHREKIAADMVRIELADALPGGGIPEPGSFVHIRVPNSPDMLLRRPISLMSARDGVLVLGVQPKGEGTKRVCALREGDELDIMGPMGKGFAVGPVQKKIWLVGGGLGVAPLVYAAERFGGEKTAYLGFRTAAHVYGAPDFEACGVRVCVASDDGSAGHHGLVTALLERDKADRPDIILACGPAPMLKAVQAFAQRENTACQLSLEERMACGVGACLVCNCKTLTKDGWTYRRVCKDGPVFDSREVAL